MPAPGAVLTTGDLLRLLRQMHEIRFFEERIDTMYGEFLIRGITHLCSGQEAVSVRRVLRSSAADDTMHLHLPRSRRRDRQGRPTRSPLRRDSWAGRMACAGARAAPCT